MEKRIITVIWVITAMVFCSIVIIIEIAPIVKAPTTWYVDDVPGIGPGNPPEDFTSIQDAINVAQPGDTVFVYNGTYFENVVVNETINLTGENKENTVINAGGNGIVVYVEVNWVNITGFTVTWGGSFFGEGGINLYNVENCKVINNIISLNMVYGIYVESSMNNKVIDNNISSNNQHNIYLSSSSWNDIIGNNISSSNWGDGINLVSSSNNNIIGNSISNNFDGIEFYSSSNNNNITGNNISSNGGFGISLRSVSNNNFAGNNFVHEGIFIGGSGLQHFNSHTILSNNIVNGEPLYFYKDSSGINIDGKPVGELIFANCTDVKVQNLRIDDTDVGIEVAFSTNIIITDNTFSNDNYGIYFQSSNGNSIVGNTASSNDKGIYLRSSTNNNIVRNKGSNNDDGITLESSSNHNIIKDNDFSGNSNGIYIVGSKNNNIAGNTFSNNGEGMRLFTSNNTITGNIVIYNNWGIRLYELSNNNRITGNIASSNAREGIYLQNSANGNIILGNDVLGNGYSGIRISSSSSDNDIMGNNVSYNGYSVNGIGIFIDSSSNNLIYHNNIIENANQASDNTNSGNQWDNGYPEGGNYWSDFDESSEGAYDDFKGPDQNVPGSDGIVDNGTIAGGGINPYEIDGDSQDYYPLINSTKNFILLYEGWNLISIPFILSDTSLGVVLNSIKGSWDAVQWYNISYNSDPWKHNSTKKPSYLNDLDRIDHTMGFWIHITELGGVLFQYPGTKPMENQTIHIHPGWNLVGYPSPTSYNRTQGLNNLTFGTHVDAILTYNAGTHKWKKLGLSDYFELGKGYWVHAKTKCEWEVPL